MQLPTLSSQATSTYLAESTIIDINAGISTVKSLSLPNIPVSESPSASVQTPASTPSLLPVSSVETFGRQTRRPRSATISDHLSSRPTQNSINNVHPTLNYVNGSASTLMQPSTVLDQNLPDVVSLSFVRGPPLVAGGHEMGMGGQRGSGLPFFNVMTPIDEMSLDLTRGISTSNSVIDFGAKSSLSHNHSHGHTPVQFDYTPRSHNSGHNSNYNSGCSTPRRNNIAVNSQAYVTFTPPSASDILSRYITASFITSLASDLCYEDDRFSSPRVSVLNALFKNCSGLNVRRQIVLALLESANQRLQRCREVVCISMKTEFDLNLVASRGFFGCGLSAREGFFSRIDVVNNADANANAGVDHNLEKYNGSSLVLSNHNSVSNTDIGINIQLMTAVVRGCGFASAVGSEWKSDSGSGCGGGFLAPGEITGRNRTESIGTSKAFFEKNTSKISSSIGFGMGVNDNLGGVDGVVDVGGSRFNQPERQGIVVRDHSNCFLEVLKFIGTFMLDEVWKETLRNVRVKIDETENRGGSSTFRSMSSDSFYDSFVASLSAIPNKYEPLKHAGQLCMFLQEILLTSLKCYSVPLGKKGDVTEQPALLKNILGQLKTIHQIHFLVSYTNWFLTNSSSLIPHVEVLLGLENRNMVLIPEQQLSAPMLEDFSLVESCLKVLLRMWNRNKCTEEVGNNDNSMGGNRTESSRFCQQGGNVIGGNSSGYVDELAMIQLAGMLLSEVIPAYSLGQLLSASVADDLRVAFSGNEGVTITKSSNNSSDIDNKGIDNRGGIKGIKVPRVKILLSRVLFRLLRGTESLHSKVACQCLSVIEDKSVLERYFVPKLPLNDNNNNNNNNSEEEHSKNSNLNKPSSSSCSWDSEVEVLPVVMEWKEQQTEKLVESLRRNRNHWHPAVKTASGRLFDTILNYLE